MGEWRGMQRVPLSEGGRGKGVEKEGTGFFIRGAERIGIERILES